MNTSKEELKNLEKHLDDIDTSIDQLAKKIFQLEDDVLSIKTLVTNKYSQPTTYPPYYYNVPASD